MMTVSYDEAVHSYIGLTLITLAAIGAFLVDRRGAPPWWRHVWLALAVFLAYITVLPAAAATPHVQHVRDQDPWLAPVRLLLALDWPETWWRDLREPHVLQHKLAGLCIAAPALAEWWIRRPVPPPAARYLQWLAPAALMGLAVIFAVHRPTHVHAGHAPDMAAMEAELFQHWVIATAFATSALALSLARLRPLQAYIPARVWYAFLGLAGLGFLAFRV
jgi:hypothetical protein